MTFTKSIDPPKSTSLSENDVGENSKKRKKFTNSKKKILTENAADRVCASIKAVIGNASDRVAASSFVDVVRVVVSRMRACVFVGNRLQQHRLTHFFVQDK